MTDHIPQEGKITPLDAAVLGNEDAFRAALAKAGSQEPEPTEDRNEIPQDVQNASANAQESVTEDEVEEDNEESVEEELESAEPEVEAKGHLIPKSRFNQEIEKRKSLEEQLSREREERIKAETQYQMLNTIQQAQLQKQTEQPIAEDIDPLDTDTYNYAKREIESLKLQLANVSYETQARAQEMQYHNMVMAQEAAFSQQNPDFKDAMKHVQDVEYNIAKDLLGDERAANEYVGAKLRDTLTRSLNSGKNAAETIYKMAKTYGYTTPQAQSKASTSKNVAAISRNMERSANTGNLGNNSGFGSIPTDIASAMNKSGNTLSGVNPEAFHKMLERLR